MIGTAYLDVQIDGNVFGWENGYLDGIGRLFRVEDVALSLEDALGKDEHALDHRIVGSRQTDFHMRLGENMNWHIKFCRL